MRTRVRRGVCESISTHRLSLSAGLFLAAAVLVLAGSDRLRADRVIFKDGFTLEGKVKQERESIVDPGSGTQLTVAKTGGYMWVDDGARKVAFSAGKKQVQDVDPADQGKGADPLVFQYPMVRANYFRLPPGQYAGITPWDAKWDRTITIESPTQGTVKMAQHMSILTPHFARIDARRYVWNSHFLTQELEPDSIRDLLYKHPTLKLKGDNTDVAKRLRVFRFLVRTGWYEKALAELNSLLKDFPEQKDKIEAARDGLKKMLAAELMDLAQQAHRAGRHQWAQARLANFPQQGADEDVLVRLRALQATYETTDKSQTEARRFLDGLPSQVADSAQQSVFTEAAAAIAAELNADTISRLEPFLGLARQVERDKQQGRSPAHSPEQLLSVAISSWLLGVGSAEVRVEAALRLWQARQFVLEYQRTHEPDARKRLLDAYQRGTAVAFDELAQLIRFLPPPESSELVQAGQGQWVLGAQPFPQAALLPALLAVQKAQSGNTYELVSHPVGSARAGPGYLLQLPPEYHPGRLYPVLFVLHEAGESPATMLKRWAFHAAQNGYLLVAPAWQPTGAARPYNYTAAEQRAVTEVLRDLRQRFQVDSDRVFLSGLGEGGNMAFDVGLSHPDLFAGVLPISGRPRYFAQKYWPNAQYLPFYVVDGDQDSEGIQANRRQFDSWVGHQYPALFVVYAGRGSEWFAGELPYMFDWMGRKKRAAPLTELGRFGAGGLFSDEFQCLRPGDNRFYWLAGEGLSDKHSNDSGRTFSYKVGPAMLQAQIGEGNQIIIHASNFKRVVVWLGPGMIDFDKPVKILLNLNVSVAKRKITPSLATLLEDFYQRGDRQRVFLAKVELGL